MRFIRVDFIYIHKIDHDILTGGLRFTNRWICLICGWNYFV